MGAVLMLDAPQVMLDERRRLGHDVRDEMRDGVLHMVPPLGGRTRRSAQTVGGRLVPAQPGPDGAFASVALGVTPRTVDGKLEITGDGGSGTV